MVHWFPLHPRFFFLQRQSLNFRRLFVTCDIFARNFIMFFLWLFRGFFVAFSWTLLWEDCTRTRPRRAFWHFVHSHIRLEIAGNASLIHSIHANTFTPFTPIVPTEVSCLSFSSCCFTEAAPAPTGLWARPLCHMWDEKGGSQKRLCGVTRAGVLYS